MKTLPKTLIAIVISLAAAFLLLSCLDAFYESESGTIEEILTGEEQPDEKGLLHPGYTLQQTVILSRHNIRSPLSGKGSVLDSITPYEWFQWTSEPGELSVRGGVLETEMGQYFRKWFEREGLFPEDCQPEDSEVRIYANAKQRTIATARFFAAGLLPNANAEVEYHGEFNSMDPVFNPQLHFMTDEYRQDADNEIHALFDEKIAGLSDNFEFLQELINMKQSEGYLDGSITDFSTEDTSLILEEDAEPGMAGSLKTACSVSDALVLQYYEAKEPEASFGRTLTNEEWEQIAEIKDVYEDVLFTAPLVASNAANPLLREIEAELNEEERKVSFLCGHDSNLASVLAALEAEDYRLPHAIEKKTPIGCKLVIGRWKGSDGKNYVSLDLVYQTAEQLRGVTLLDDENPPAAVPVYLKGLKTNRDGLYEEEAFEKRLKEAIDRYQELQESYAVPDAA